jgi:alanyl-tRNA synthetase
VTLRLYREDAYLLEFEARVLERREHEGHPAVVLDRTAFFAASGGQPSDSGRLGGIPVLDVVEEGDAVIHVLEQELTDDSPRGEVDATRRRDNRQQHHGQHLLSRALTELHGARTLSVHLGRQENTVDVDRPLSAPQIRAAEARACEVIWEARPVTVRTVPRSEAEALGVTAAEHAGDDVRLVEAEGFDLQACSGTHPRSTAEVGLVLVLGSERYKSGVRLRFLCGHRALEATHARVEAVDRLAAIHSAPLPELPEAAERLKQQLAEAERRGKLLLARALKGEARELLAAQSARPAQIVATFDDRPPGELRSLADEIVSLEPAVALLASRGEKAHLVFAQSPGLPHDIPALLRRALELLGGRGGGRGDVAQGAGPNLDRLDEALRTALDAVAKPAD